MTTRTYQPGDTVYADFSRYSTTTVAQGTVLTVSRTGVIRAAFDIPSGIRREVSFMPTGWERGGDRWYRARLIDAETYAARRATMLTHQARLTVRKTTDELLALANRNASRADLLAQCDTVRRAIEALPDA